MNFAIDYDVIFVDSLARGHSRIKEVTPDLVVVLLAIDDVAACHLLSMLKIDREMSDVSVVTCVTRREEGEFEDIIGGEPRLVESSHGHPDGAKCRER